LNGIGRELLSTSLQPPQRVGSFVATEVQPHTVPLPEQQPPQQVVKSTVNHARIPVPCVRPGGFFYPQKVVEEPISELVPEAALIASPTTSPATVQPTATALPMSALENELYLEREKTKELMTQLHSLKSIKDLKRKELEKQTVQEAKMKEEEEKKKRQEAQEQLLEKQRKQQALEEQKEQQALKEQKEQKEQKKQKEQHIKSQTASFVAPAALKIYVPPPPNPSSPEWEQVHALVRPLPLYTREIYSQLDALKSVNALLVEPMMKGDEFYLLSDTGATSATTRTTCQLRIGGDHRILHWSIINEKGMYRGSLLLKNVFAIEVVQSSCASNIFILKSNNNKKIPIELIFESKDTSTLETWVSGLKFIRDVIPVAGVPHIQRARV
jgi:hypothetical protein